MLNEFFESFCKSIVSQFKLPRKGLSVFLLIFVSCTIAINKCIFHYSLAPKGSLLLQLIYFLWGYSVFSIFAKAYNEYCDKKDAEKKENELNKKAEKNINLYMEAFDLCDNEEKEVLVSFYYRQCTSVRVKNVAIIRAMKNKGIDILSFEGSFSESGKALTSTTGLKIINKYFNKEKNVFFKLLKSFDEKEINLMKEFINLNDEQIEIYKRETKIAKSIIRKFQETKFDDIYIDSDGFLTIPTLYLAYLSQYFSE